MTILADDRVQDEPVLRSVSNPIGVVKSDDPQAIEKLRQAYLDLQADIAAVIPPAKGDRANDPIIARVLRLKQERDDLLESLAIVAGTDKLTVGDHVVVQLGVVAHFVKRARKLVRRLRNLD